MHAKDTISHTIKEIADAVGLSTVEQETIVSAVLASKQYATTHTTIGRDGKIGGYYVKVISQWNEKMTDLCFVAAYFSVEHHLGPFRTIRGFHADALRACER